MNSSEFLLHAGVRLRQGAWPKAPTLNLDASEETLCLQSQELVQIVCVKGILFNEI